MVATVQPPLMERELVDMFMGTLQGPYYMMMIGSTSVGFSDLVMAGKRVETGIKLGRIQVPVANSSNSSTKPFGGFQKKKEGETSAVFSSRSRFQPFQHYLAPYLLIPYQQASYQQIPYHQQQLL